MDNNDILKKLRVALQLRDDQIVEILQLVDFRISKGEVGNFFRNADHPKYVSCGDQVLRNFLNGLVLHLRGPREAPKDPKTVLATTAPSKTKKPAAAERPKAVKKPVAKPKPIKKVQVVEKVRFKNGKKSPKNP